MAHAFPADFLKRNLNTTLFACDAFVFHTLVFTAQTFVILGRAKDTREEEPVPLRLEGSVIYGFRLLNLTERPRPDAFRRSDRNLNLVKALDTLVLTENFH